MSDSLKEKYLNELVFFCILIALIYLNLIVSYDLKHLDWTYPHKYSGDILAVFQQLKMMMIGDWPVYGIPKSSTMSAPFGFAMGDFGGPNTSQNLFIKCFTFLSDNVFVVFNSYVITSYFLCAIGMYVVLRKFSITPFIAVGASLLFTFTPFHYFRIGHFAYINYFYLPILIYFIIKIWDRIPLFYNGVNGEIKLSLSFKNVSILLLFAFFGSWQFYYSFFLCYFICVVTLSAFFIHKNVKHIVSGCVLIFTVSLSFLISYLPFKYFQYLNGANDSIASRIPEESKTYSLRMSDLFSPVFDHRLLALDDLPEYFFAGSAALGLVAVIGLIYGFIILITKVDIKNLQSRFSILLLSGILLMTYSGLSYLVALYITPSIRGYERGSIYIALFSIVLLSILLNGLYLKTSFKSRYVLSGSIILLFIIGLWDISSTRMSFAANSEIKGLIDSQKSFVESIQQELATSETSKVLQLPHMSFPESLPKNKMGDYSNSFVNYFATDQTIHWSNSALRGRESDIWIKELLKLDLSSQLKVLKKSGFNGLMLDRFGYLDNGDELITKLGNLVEGAYIEDETKRYVFFELQADKNSNAEPIQRILAKNFWGWEGQWGAFSWAKGDATLFIPNNSKGVINYTLEFSLTTLVPRNAKFTIEGTEYNLELIPGQLKPISQEISVPTGGIYIQITSEQPAYRVSRHKLNSEDNRKISFGLANFKLLRNGVEVIHQFFRNVN